MNSIIEQKSFQFAVRIVNLCKHLRNAKKEHILSKQLLRSGTSIGANTAEAQQAQSKADFISKLSIALKETTETKYWLNLLQATDYLLKQNFTPYSLTALRLRRYWSQSLRLSRNKNKFSIFNFQFLIKKDALHLQRIFVFTLRIPQPWFPG